jgi:acetyl esterase
MDAEERNDGRWRRSAHRGGGRFSRRQYRRGTPAQGARRRPAGAAGRAARPDHDFFFEKRIVERLAPLGIVYDTAFIGFIRGAYLVHGRNWGHPHASPTRADLHGYPATFIATGTADPLVDDNRAFAEKLRAAGGTEVEHLVRDGMPHGFYFFPGMFKQGDQAFAAIAAFLKRTGLA